MANEIQEEEWEEMEATRNPIWKFEENTELIGYFQNVRAKVGPNLSNLYTFKTEKDELIDVWGNTILDNRLANLQIGEKIKINYLGKTESPKTGRKYHDFKVFHSKAKHPENELTEEGEEIPV